MLKGNLYSIHGIMCTERESEKGKIKWREGWKEDWLRENGKERELARNEGEGIGSYGMLWWGWRRNRSQNFLHFSVCNN